MKRALLIAMGWIFLIPAACKIPDAEVIQRLQELQRCSFTIKSTVFTIKEIVENIEIDISILGEQLSSQIDAICTGTSGGSINCTEVLNEISLLGESLSSQIDAICTGTVSVNCNEVLDEISILGENLSSQIDAVCGSASCCDEVLNEISILGESLSSQIDAISTTTCTAVVDFTEVLIAISQTDVLIESTIGNFDDQGSCLDSLIDVPDDINNMNLNVIQLLKTILLELRGCGAC